MYIINPTLSLSVAPVRLEPQVKVYSYRPQTSMRLPGILCLQLVVVTGMLLCQQMSACEGLKIATFNIQQLGIRKIENEAFVTPLANVCDATYLIPMIECGLILQYLFP